MFKTRRSLSGTCTCLLNFLFILVLVQHGAGQSCIESRCGDVGPDIRFPFRIKDKQPQECGYAGFELSCTEGNNTMLELPNSSGLQVQSIDYISQVIYASALQRCLPSLLHNLNLSAPHFQLQQSHGKYDFTLFNCSSQVPQLREGCCISAPTYNICSIPADSSVQAIDLISCTKMYDLASLPPYYTDSASLPLTWINPKCGQCEAKGLRCRQRNNSTECYENRGITIGFPLLALAVIKIYRIYSFDKIEKQYRAKLCSKDKSAVTMTTARGTIGYMAPEVFSRNFGDVSYKSDVYSFGMLVLEMVGGRKIVDDTAGNGEQIYFPEWIYNLLDEGEDLRVHIEEEGDAKIAKKLAIVGLWCIQWNPGDRPSMKTVVQMLEGEGENLTKPPNPFGSSTPTQKTSASGLRRPVLKLKDLATITEAE
ncbi:hypothetical protein Tsubulata_000101 [Turnera subulata]|uniref:Protein kinase domain-containing protein n=1 Tax=Turnera subulata TaxID=218843 RepID=A0A9Q0FJD1_9ROSI|nr:hypothetical protein Tsubulata_000101 [Turnera subulata]